MFQTWKEKVIGRKKAPPTHKVIAEWDGVTASSQKARSQESSSEEIVQVPELGPEYTVDGERAQDFLGAVERIPKEVLDAWGNTIRHWPATLQREGYTLQLGRALGSGSFGTVMEAQREPDLNTPKDIRPLTVEQVVVKFIILNPDSERYEKRLQTVFRELAALSQNNMLYDAYQLQTEGVDDTIVIAIEMKKLEGPNVYEYIEALEGKSERYSSEKRLEIMKMIRNCLVQLRVLAKRGWQHRDVKPENILTNHGNTRIADFGIARRVEDTTGQQRSGTPVYMTAKTVEAKKDVFADIYALGLIAGEEMGYLRRERLGNPIQTMIAILQGNLWKKSSQSEALEMHTKAEELFTQLIEEIVQIGAGKDQYRNSMGEDEFSKENLVQTITTVLRRVHEIVKQQEREIVEEKEERIAA